MRWDDRSASSPVLLRVTTRTPWTLLAAEVTAIWPIPGPEADSSPIVAKYVHCARQLPTFEITPWRARPSAVAALFHLAELGRGERALLDRAAAEAVALGLVAAQGVRECVLIHASRTRAGGGRVAAACKKPTNHSIRTQDCAQTKYLVAKRRPERDPGPPLATR